MTTSNPIKKIDRVISIFRKNYKKQPLEVYRGNPYKILIATLLSSRTKDEVTYSACEKLFSKASDIKKLNQLSQSEIQDLIYPVGFYKKKAIYLKKLSRIIVEKHKGKIPDSRASLMSLPGVGRKTANLVLSRAFGKNTIAVDTHVHRISNMLGLVKTKTPQQTEEELSKILPKKYWHEINKLFVAIGRQFPSKKKLAIFLKKHKLI